MKEVCAFYISLEIGKKMQNVQTALKRSAEFARRRMRYVEGRRLDREKGIPFSEKPLGFSSLLKIQS